MTQCKIEWAISADANTRYAQRLNTDAPNLNVVKELQLRQRPIREQWEARGPGLLQAITQQLPWITYPRNVTVQLVQPIRGGGSLFIDQDIYFEAVLANPHAQVPEVLRIAWMIARMAVAQSTEARCSDPLQEQIPGLALIPDVLYGGQQVELSKCDPATVLTAIKAWQCPSTTELGDPEQILGWWHNRPSDSANHWWAGLADFS